MSLPLPDQPTALLPAGPDGRPAWWRRLSFLVPVAAALALVVIGGVLLLLLPRSASPGSAATTVPATSGAAPKPSGRDGHAIRGAIVSESGSTWTVRTTEGRTVTVLVTSQTRFGTAKHPQAAGDFPVGTTVVVTGT